MLQPGDLRDPTMRDGGRAAGSPWSKTGVAGHSYRNASTGSTRAARRAGSSAPARTMPPTGRWLLRTEHFQRIHAGSSPSR